MSGLTYPPHDYATQVAQQGYFIYVDRNAANISLIRGADMEICLKINPRLLFVIPVALVGVEEDVRASLSQRGFSKPEIDSFLTQTINSSNIGIAQSFIEHYRRLSEPQPEFPGFTYPVTKNYSSDFITKSRQRIHDEITATYLHGNPNFTTLPPILDPLYRLYDKYFFQSQLSQLLVGKKLTIQYSKMTSRGGSCDKNGCEYTIKIGGPVMLGTFTKNETFHIANGLQCTDRLYCLMNILEHEIIHLIIQNVTGHKKADPVYGSHGDYFQQLAHAYFGHTAFRHSLNVSVDTHRTREDFRVGQSVKFEHKGTKMVGVIDQLNPKTARVGTYLIPYLLLEPSMEMPTIKPTKSKLDFHLGQQVSFTAKGGIRVNGVITKLNPIRAKVEQLGKPGFYTVPYDMLN
jgi:hypothetical protein